MGVAGPGVLRGGAHLHALSQGGRDQGEGTPVVSHVIGVGRLAPASPPDWDFKRQQPRRDWSPLWGGLCMEIMCSVLFLPPL